MKILNGAEVAAYIKERQAKQVRALRQADHVAPCVAIVVTQDDTVSATYLRLKQQYGEDILVEVRLENVGMDDVVTRIESLNADPSVHGIVVQLPLPDPSQTDAVLNTVAPAKDVDGLRTDSAFDAPTPLAINWLLSAYNISLTHRPIAIVGNGRLVGAPLARMWRNSGLQVEVLDKKTPDLAAALQQAEVIVTATGVPGLVTSDMIRPDSVVVDAGTSTDGGHIVGDLAPDVYERHDLAITPTKGGVGPLTLTALFDNVIRAARATVTPEERYTRGLL